MYEIEWTTAALRELGKLDKPLGCRLLIPITKLSVDPRPPGTRTLVGQPSGTMRLRVGDHRVVYVVEDRRLVITVVRLAHRGDVYRSL
jgi:mRNA interferase RelE/StbE